MERNDQDLAFMLKYENVAWYDKSAALVRILDRRVYPGKLRYLECSDYREVIKAIRDMVTQSGGPYIAAAMAMALASRQILGQAKNATDFEKKIAAAAAELSRACTTSKSSTGATRKAPPRRFTWSGNSPAGAPS